MAYQHILSRGFLCVVISIFVETGTVLGGWVPPVNVSNDRHYFAGGAHIAFDSNGHAHMAYHNFHDTIGGIWYTNNVTGSWTTPVKLVETGGKPSGPRILITPDDVIHIFWGNNGHYEVTRPVSGGNWSAPQRIDDVYQGGYFADAVELANGGIYVAWLRLFDSNPEPRNALWGRYKPLGGDWGPEELIVLGFSDDNWPGGSWLKARGNEVYCTYNMGSALYKIRSEQGTWSDIQSFDDKAGGVRFAWSPDGSEMAAAYAYDVDGDASQRWFEVFVRFSYDDGQTWTPEYNVSDKVALDRNVEITYDPAGDLHVIWQNFACDGCQPEVSCRSRVDGIWQPRQNISNTPAARTGFAQNAIRCHDDTLWLVYSDNPIDGFEDVYVTYNHLNLAPQAPGPVTSFAIQPGNQKNVLSWTNPMSGYYSATMIRASTTGYPADPQEGTLVVDKVGFAGYQDTFTHTGLSNGQTYYYSAFAHSWHPEYAAGTHASAIPHVPGDFDADNDIDIEDFGAFQLCLSGEFVPQDDPECIDAFMDSDNDVDQDDVSIFHNCMTGDGLMVDPDCGS